MVLQPLLGKGEGDYLGIRCVRANPA